MSTPKSIHTKPELLARNSELIRQISVLCDHKDSLVRTLLDVACNCTDPISREAAKRVLKTVGIEL